MDIGDRGAIFTIHGEDGFEDARLHLFPDPQQVLVLRYGTEEWPIQRCHWSDIRGLRNLPHGAKDSKVCFVEDNDGLTCEVGRRGNIIIFNVREKDPLRYRETRPVWIYHWKGKINVKELGIP